MQTKKPYLLISVGLTFVALFTLMSLIIHSDTLAANVPQSGALTALDVTEGYTLTVNQGDAARYTHILTNTDEVTRSFVIAAESSEGWPVAILGTTYPVGTDQLPIWDVGEGMTGTFEISLTVPHTAPYRISNFTTVTITRLPVEEGVTRVITNVAVIGDATVYLPAIMNNFPRPWQHSQGIAPDTIVYDIVACPGNPAQLFAGTRSGLYVSQNSGQTWRLWGDEDLDGFRVTPVVAYVSGEACHAYAAVWGAGIYHITPQATELIGEIEEDGDLRYVYGMALRPAEDSTLYTEDSTLYVGTDEDGIYKREAGSWSAIDLGHNETRIRSLYFIEEAGKHVLYAGARDCTLHRIQDQQITQMRHTPCRDDEQVWAVAQSGDNTLYASLGSRGLYRVDVGGGNWSRIRDVPAAAIYHHGIINVGDHIIVSTYGEGLYRCTATGCARYRSNGLDTPRLLGMKLLEGRLLLSSDQGIWYLDLP